MRTYLRVPELSSSLVPPNTLKAASTPPSITYTPSKRWDLRLNITNLLSNRVLDPIDVSFAGNDVIYVRAPISASMTLRLHY